MHDPTPLHVLTSPRPRSSEGEGYARPLVSRCLPLGANACTVFQLLLIFGSVEVSLGGSDQPVCTDLPYLEATDADPVSGASWTGVGARQGPVVLGSIRLYN